MITVAVLEYKRGSIAEKRGSFASLISQSFAQKKHNALCLNILSPKRSKLKNFAPKILLCAQLIVLSIRNANIVSGKLTAKQQFTVVKANLGGYGVSP